MVQGLFSLQRIQNLRKMRHGRDWRGGVAVAVGNGAGRAPRNPGKPFAEKSAAILNKYLN